VILLSLDGRSGRFDGILCSRLVVSCHAVLDYQQRRANTPTEPLIWVWPDAAHKRSALVNLCSVLGGW